MGAGVDYDEITGLPLDSSEKKASEISFFGGVWAERDPNGGEINWAHMGYTIGVPVIFAVPFVLTLVTGCSAAGWIATFSVSLLIRAGIWNTAAETDSDIDILGFRMSHTKFG